jgi:hypothetical protein
VPSQLLMVTSCWLSIKSPQLVAAQDHKGMCQQI